MKMDLHPYADGSIEVEKVKEFFHRYNKDDLFNSFISDCTNEKVAMGIIANTKIRFSYEDKRKRYFWMEIEMIPNMESDSENDETMELIDIGYFDPERDYRNG